jgi:hypothetical protein
MRTKLIVIIGVMILLLTSCSSKGNEDQTVSAGIEIPQHEATETNEYIFKSCSNGVIDYFDAIMWNDISYYFGGETDSGNSQENTKVKKGKELGEISYNLADSACLGYKMKNGDATYLPIGSKVYEVEGYHSDFRLIAGDKLYQTNDNPNATRVSDVYDIEGKVSRISLESTEDGRFISFFSEEATKAFIEEYLQLAYLGVDTLYNTGKGAEAKGVEFLRLHLSDDTSFQIVYMTEENLISPGASGTERMLAIIEEHIQSQKPKNE